MFTCRPTKKQSPTTKRMLGTRDREETPFLRRSYALATAFEVGDNNSEWQTLHSTISALKTNLYLQPIKIFGFKHLQHFSMCPQNIWQE